MEDLLGKRIQSYYVRLMICAEDSTKPKELSFISLLEDLLFNAEKGTALDSNQLKYARHKVSMTCLADKYVDIVDFLDDYQRTNPQ